MGKKIETCLISVEEDIWLRRRLRSEDFLGERRHERVKFRLAFSEFNATSEYSTTPTDVKILRVDEITLIDSKYMTVGFILLYVKK